LGGINGGNAGTTGWDKSTLRYSAPRYRVSRVLTVGRMATIQDRSRVICAEEDEEEW
jgi:hypothetical protein